MFDIATVHKISTTFSQMPAMLSAILGNARIVGAIKDETLKLEQLASLGVEAIKHASELLYANISKDDGQGRANFALATDYLRLGPDEKLAFRESVTRTDKANWEALSKFGFSPTEVSSQQNAVGDKGESRFS